MSSSIYKVAEHTSVGHLWMGATCPAGAHYRVMHVTLRFSAAPTTSELLTIALNANAGAEYDTVFYTFDPSASGVSHVVWYPDGFEWIIGPGDEVAVTYANSDFNTVACEITLKRV